MSIDVYEQVQRKNMERADCILCGQCADNCNQKVIFYSFGRK
jgi:ferredoxin